MTTLISFLCSFEQILSDNNIPKAQWLGLLVPNLGSGKARDAYTDIHASDHLTYDMLKRCMLKRYELTPEAYRRKFRGHSCSDNQSFKEANFKLAYLFDKWLETSNIPKTYNGLRVMMLMDQANRWMPYELSQYVQEKEPSSLKEMGTVTDKQVAIDMWRQH